MVSYAMATRRHDNAMYAHVCLLGSAVAARDIAALLLRHCRCHYSKPPLVVAGSTYSETLSTGPRQGPTSSQMMGCACAERIVVTSLNLEASLSDLVPVPHEVEVTPMLYTAPLGGKRRATWQPWVPDRDKAGPGPARTSHPRVRTAASERR